MPAVSSRGKGRRTVVEINMVPFIDVMLVLLIIFMVTAPMLTPGNIDVPTAGKSSKPAAKNIAYVLLEKDGRVIFKTKNTEQQIALPELQGIATSWKNSDPEHTAIQILADKTLPYESVVQAMAQLQAAEVRVALGVKSSSN
ncbi:biopolymer transporter ExbD [Comamonas aquatica]|jgi:biopolymer transport protein TolR|uniref:Biopolymer transport protein exbD n=1 Tax=Comamonas aquatica TaxID=225991 RepID=A0AA35DAH3_9BURK|nr:MULTISPECIES: biopolymer transporter ExbD [Comamonas]ANY61969.1 protein TolR [Comamonas aquatica]MDE1554960.1 biopolymer transporter ExbD [Comamonas aquatica]MDH0201627.1 biopolymer transporter ExbD [Comamonas aquatica]MDH0362657.1 biopolymer transporter ExbD [Comamonas aquatica]MDH0381213.1 biopolymer transporter ExbD [Comamonas aquatica]